MLRRTRMGRTSWAALLLVAMAFPAAGASPPAVTAALQPSRAPGFHPETLCDNVYGRMLVRDSAGNSTRTYYYQAIFGSEAGVEEGDSPEVARQKIQDWWRTTGQFHTCTPNGFIDGGGSLLKLALHRSFRDFVDDATVRWKLELNHVGEADGRTVLDYIASEMERKQGTTIHATLRNYYGQFEAAGAKRRRDIDGIDCTFWPNPDRMDRRCPQRRR
jgi:hypothetical protein